MPFLHEHSPAPEHDRRGRPEEGEGGGAHLVALCLDPAFIVYRAELDPWGLSALHREVIARFLMNPAHSLYAALTAGDVSRLWIGPSQSPVQVLFSHQVQRCADGNTRPVWAVAFADVADGAPIHREAEARLRQLEAGPWPARPASHPALGLTLAG